MPVKYVKTGKRAKGGSKKGSHSGAGAKERQHMGWGNANLSGEGKPKPKRARRGKGRISVVSVARYLEFGTTKMGKKPFMVAGFKAAQGKATDILIRGIKEALDKACRK
jgi:hypothetical protein